MMRLIIYFAVIYTTSLMALSQEAVVPPVLITWRFPVTVSAAESEEVKEQADKLAVSLGKPNASRVNENPVCTMWVSLEKWAPNPRSQYYLINIQFGGATLTATNLEQLKLGVQHIIKLRQAGDDGLQALPIGIITNLPINNK